MKSYQFVAKFEARDTQPVSPDDFDTDAEYEAARRAQVVAITKRILPDTCAKASDKQVWQLWRDHMRGIY